MNTGQSIRHLACIALACLVPLPVIALDAFLQSNRIYDGDIATLVLQYENDIPSLYALDTSPLESDFEVIDAQSRVHRINDPDDPALLMEWVVEIAPRSQGKLVIPPLRLGDHVSDPLWLEVERRPQDDLEKTDISLEMSVSPINPYPGQQVVVALRLLSNITLSSGRVFEPNTGQGRVYRNREDRHYSVTREGRQYKVLERNLVLFADQTQPLHLGPSSFRGRLHDQPKRQVLRKSNPIELMVRPKPAGYDYPFWLPATNLKISQHWEVPDLPLEVGQSLGFTLNIEAHGLAAESLPDNLAHHDHPSFKIYADEAIRSDAFEGTSLVGRLQQSFVFVASRSGVIDVPAITLPWWDTDNDALNLATLPGRRFDVIDPVRAQSDSLSGNRVILDLEGSQSSGISQWVWLACLLLVGTFLLWGRNSMGRRLLYRVRRLREIRAAREAFKQACLGNEPSLARDRLISLARQRWPDENFFGLQSIDDKFGNHNLSVQLNQLDLAIYGKENPIWAGKHLWQAWVACRKTPAGFRSKTRSALPRLYPAGFRRRLSPSP